jgi:hypothetical protein
MKAVISCKTPQRETGEGERKREKEREKLRSREILSFWSESAL